MKIVVLIGIPGSGKTTYAKTLVAQGYARVNLDDYRAMMFPGLSFTKKNEKLVYEHQMMIVKDLLALQRDVVVDNTHLNPYKRKQLFELAVDQGHEYIEHLMQDSVDLAFCQRRVVARANAGGMFVPMDVIENMHKKYIEQFGTKE